MLVELLVVCFVGAFAYLARPIVERMVDGGKDDSGLLEACCLALVYFDYAVQDHLMDNITHPFTVREARRRIREAVGKATVAENDRHSIDYALWVKG